MAIDLSGLAATAQKLVAPKKGILAKIAALPRIAAFYGIWYPTRWLHWGHWPRFEEYGALGKHLRFIDRTTRKVARQVFHAGLARTVLAVPIAQERATMHLDTICTLVDVDKVVMYPNVADHLVAHAVTLAEDGDEATLTLDVAPPEPFLEAAAKAMGIDQLHRIDTGLDPVTAEREQWDDGNNTLAIAPRVAVAYERNDQTNERLEEAGIEVVRIAGSELGSGRGGPRCTSCPITRDPL